MPENQPICMFTDDEVATITGAFDHIISNIVSQSGFECVLESLTFVGFHAEARILIGMRNGQRTWMRPKFLRPPVVAVTGGDRWLGSITDWRSASEIQRVEAVGVAVRMEVETALLLGDPTRIMETLIIHRVIHDFETHNRMQPSVPNMPIVPPFRRTDIVQNVLDIIDQTHGILNQYAADYVEGGDGDALDKFARLQSRLDGFIHAFFSHGATP